MGSAVVSVDLAYKRWPDIGIAVLRPSRMATRCELVRAHARAGEPDPEQLALYLCGLCAGAGAQLLLIDGPQAWKDPHNGLEHSRVCERRLATPAKTGLPGQVKPAAYTSFVEFSIALFDALQRRGFPRLDERGLAEPRSCRAAIEVFPFAAWRALGIEPLPSKGRARPRDLGSRTRALVQRCSLELSADPSHDELQAIAAGIAGLALAQARRSGFEAIGVPPFELAGAWREGFILSPPRSAPT
jgi:hypothetical protein